MLAKIYSLRYPDVEIPHVEKYSDPNESRRSKISTRSVSARSTPFKVFEHQNSSVAENLAKKAKSCSVVYGAGRLRKKMNKNENKRIYGLKGDEGDGGVPIKRCKLFVD